MIKLYENICHLRKLHNWTQEELAKKMGYKDRSMIAKIEAGQVDLGQSKILEFAKIFNVAPGDLMGWEDEHDESRDVEKALQLYEKYKNSIPEIQSAVEALLKPSQSDP